MYFSLHSALSLPRPNLLFMSKNCMISYGTDVNSLISTFSQEMCVLRMVYGVYLVFSHVEAHTCTSRGRQLITSCMCSIRMYLHICVYRLLYVVLVYAVEPLYKGHIETS